jgi:hypothetical protein
MQAALPGGADVHAGTLADRVEPFEYLDRLGAIFFTAASHANPFP